MSITITGRRGAREVVLTRQTEEEADQVSTVLRKYGFNVTATETLSDAEHKQLKRKINRICLEYILNEGANATRC